MALNIEQELAALRRMTAEDLQRRYAEVFGEQPRSRNRMWLIKRIAWRLQAMAEGDLSERARQRAAELANDADLRTTAPRKLKITADAEQRTKICSVTIQTDARLPMPGTLITRDYKGQMLHGEGPVRRVRVRRRGLQVAHRRGQGRHGHPLERLPLLRAPEQRRFPMSRRNGTTPTQTPRSVRCAIYTRKSTEEGLDQEFNSLDAQRESGEAYITSQQHEGWMCLPDRYDDGGFTGGNMDRPA